MRAWLSGNSKKPWPGSEGPSGNQALPPGLALVSSIFPHQLLVTTFPADQLRLFSSSPDRETELREKRAGSRSQSWRVKDVEFRSLMDEESVPVSSTDSGLTRPTDRC